MGVLQGKVAIVTGGGQGLGRGMALAFAKEGASVVIAEINPTTAEAVADEIRRLGQRALGVVCDVGNEAQIKQMVDRAAKEFGRIDILVNNAQSWGPKGPERRPSPILTPLEEFPEEWWDITFQTGVKATFYCCKAVFHHMKNRGGKIINFASIRGIEGMDGTVDFNANKEAIRALSRTAAREWGKYKINVNVIIPAAYSPSFELYEKEHPEIIEEHLRSMPLGRFGHAEKDIGRVAVFLASEDSDFITGDTFMVNGGRFMFP